MAAGYSGTPLIKKLGIKPEQRVLFINAPDHYRKLLGTLPDHTVLLKPDGTQSADFIHFFAGDEQTLNKWLPLCKKRLDKEGMVWVSWIKKSSALETDISESDVRNKGLEVGLVDVKICAVDKDWSALKFVYRKKDR